MMGSKRLAAIGILLSIGWAPIAVADDEPTRSAPGDILLEACGYSSPQAAQAVWRPVGRTLPVAITEIDSRRAVSMRCGFVDVADLDVARWRRDLVIDLTGRLGLQLDVYCDRPGPIESLSLQLLDATGEPFAQSAAALIPGWNTISVIRPKSTDAAFDAKWATIAGVSIAATPARRVNVRFAIANLRVVGPDPLISLTRLADHDCVDLRQGEIIRGTLQNLTYGLNTRLGKLTFDAEHVVGLRTTRSSGTRVQILLVDGQVFSGTLADNTVHLAMTIGEVLKVPVRRLRQCAYRISPAKPLYRKPQAPVLMFDDNRAAFEVADDFRFTLTTNHGTVSVAPSSLARLEVIGDGADRWRALLRNGSILIGALGPATIDATLVLPGGRRQTTTVVTGQIRRFHWPCAIEAPTDATTIELFDDQRLYGRLDTETLAIKGPFGSEDVPIGDIVSMTVSPIDTRMATVSLWGEKILRGRLLDKTVPFALVGTDVTLQISADRIRSITNAGALTTKQFAAKVNRLIDQLDAGTEMERTSAYKELVRTGAPALPLIRQRLGDPNPFIRRALLAILAEIG